MNRIKYAILASFLGFSLTYISHAHANEDQCYKMGDTITVKGRTDKYVNGGTQVQLLNNVPCVDFRGSSYSGTKYAELTKMTTVGKKVPPDVFLEITGILSDPEPVIAVGIRVLEFRNIDAEMKAKIKAAKVAVDNQCSAWQAEKTASLKAQNSQITTSSVKSSDRVDLITLVQGFNQRGRCGLHVKDPTTYKAEYIWMPLGEKIKF